MSHFWKQLEKNNKLRKGIHSGFYSALEETFVPKSEVLYDFAGKKHIHLKSGAVVEQNEEKNYIFDLREYKEMLKENYSSNKTIVDERFKKQIMAEIQELPEVGISIYIF